MKKNAIVSLALKLLGIYSIIHGLPHIGGILSSFAITGDWEVQKYIFFGAMTSFVLLIIGGLILISLGNKIGKDPNSSDKEPNESNNTPSEASYLSELAFAMFGLFIIITVISVLPRFFGDLYAVGAMANSEHTIKTRFFLTTIASAINIVFQFTIGIWLFIGSKSFLKLWQKLRQRWDYERNMDAK